MILNPMPNKSFFGLIIAALFIILPSLALAQDTTATATDEAVSDVPVEEVLGAYEGSLFFSEGELLKIRAALAGETDFAIEIEDDAGVDPTKPRLIRLSGIAYTNQADWMVWINGARITPYAKLSEIYEIYVQKDYVDLKWYDRASQKIIRIRLRPNQVYDINAGILLPG